MVQRGPWLDSLDLEHQILLAFRCKLKVSWLFLGLKSASFQTENLLPASLIIKPNAYRSQNFSAFIIKLADYYN